MGECRGGGWPFLAKPASAMGEGTVLMASGGLLSLFKVFFSTCALIVACASDHGGGGPFLAKPASAMGEGTVSMASDGLLFIFKVSGLSAICVSDSGRVDVWGRL